MSRLQREQGDQHSQLGAGRHAGQPGQPLLRRGAEPARGVPAAARVRAGRAAARRRAAAAAARRRAAR